MIAEKISVLKQNCGSCQQMITSSINRDRDINNDVQALTNVSGVLIKNAWAVGSKPFFSGHPKDVMCASHAACASSRVFKQYLEGIRHLARKKQHRCISQELG